MTEDIKTQDAGTADKAKAAIAILIVIAGIAGYYFLDASPTWERWLAVIASLVIGGLILAYSYYGREFYRFMEAARGELRKVVWPTRDETLKTTAVVFLFVGIAGVFFWLLDLVLAWATKMLTGQGGS